MHVIGGKKRKNPRLRDNLRVSEICFALRPPNSEVRTGCVPSLAALHRRFLAGWTKGAFGGSWFIGCAGEAGRQGGRQQGTLIVWKWPIAPSLHEGRGGSRAEQGMWKGSTVRVWPARLQLVRRWTATPSSGFAGGSTAKPVLRLRELLMGGMHLAVRVSTWPCLAAWLPAIAGSCR